MTSEFAEAIPVSAGQHRLNYWTKAVIFTGSGRQPTWVYCYCRPHTHTHSDTMTSLTDSDIDRLLREAEARLPSKQGDNQPDGTAAAAAAGSYVPPLKDGAAEGAGAQTSTPSRMTEPREKLSVRDARPKVVKVRRIVPQCHLVHLRTVQNQWLTTRPAKRVKIFTEEGHGRSGLVPHAQGRGDGGAQERGAAHRAEGRAGGGEAALQAGPREARAADVRAPGRAARRQQGGPVEDQPEGPGRQVGARRRAGVGRHPRVPEEEVLGHPGREAERGQGVVRGHDETKIQEMRRETEKGKGKGYTNGKLIMGVFSFQKAVWKRPGYDQLRVSGVIVSVSFTFFFVIQFTGLSQSMVFRISGAELSTSVSAVLRSIWAHNRGNIRLQCFWKRRLDFPKFKIGYISAGKILP